MDSESYKKVLKILQLIVLKTEIQTLSLVKFDGSSIAFFSEVVDGGFETQISLSAMISAISMSAQMVCNKLIYGEPREVIIRGSKGYTIFFISEFILVGGANDIRTMAISLRVFRFYFPKIYGVFYPKWALENNISLDV